MQFAEHHAVFVLRRVLAHDQMMLERRFVLVAAGNLFVPREAKVVRAMAGDDVVVSVAVDIVRVHFRPAVAFAERDFVWNPSRRQLMCQRLLQPTIGMNDVLPAVTVDVTDAQPVAEFLGGNLRRYRMKFPCFKRLVPVDGREAEESVSRAHQFWTLSSPTMLVS